MQVTRTDRNFEVIDHPKYPPTEPPLDTARLIQASSAVGSYADAIDRPGTSFLWIGLQHHLNREEVAELIQHLVAWLATGSLKVHSQPAAVHTTESTEAQHE